MAFQIKNEPQTEFVGTGLLTEENTFCT